MRRKPKLTYANVISTLCLFMLLGGGAWAAGQSHHRKKLHIPRNAVGPRQLKAKAVLTGKLANGAVTSRKVADGSLTGADINLNALGTVPEAAHAAKASDAGTLSGHSASCPPGTDLIRGLCFDKASGEAGSVTLAADACAARGGWLPTAMELYSVRGVINLGTGIGADKTFTDSYYANTNGTNYRTVTVDGTGAISEQEVDSPAHYICAYELVR
jgi:hypothetical protein